MFCGERQSQRGKGGEELADVGGLYYHPCLADVQAQAASEGYVSLALPQPGFVWMAIAPISIKDHGDAWGLGYHLKPCLCPRAMLLLDPYWYEQPMWSPRIMVTFRCKLLSKAMRTMCVDVWGTCKASPALLWTKESWPFPS